MNFIRRSLKIFFFTPLTPAPLGALRVILGFMMMLEAVGIYGSISELFGPRGFLQADLMKAISGSTIPMIHPVLEKFGISYSSLLYVIYFTRWPIYCFFILGICTKASTIFLWITQVFFLYSGQLSSYGLDRYFHILLFLLIWVPLDCAFSYKIKWKVGEPSVSAGFSLRMLQLAVLFTYVDAGISKAMGSDWWNGEAIWRALNLPEFSQFNFLWLSQFPILAIVLCWGTLFLETFYIFGVWFFRLGIFWAIGIILMHLGIAAFMGLVTFGISLALINSVLFLYCRKHTIESVLYRENKKDLD